MRPGSIIKLFMLVVFVFATYSHAHAGASVTMSEDLWPPYTLGKEGYAPTGGIAVELTNEIFKRIYVQVDLKLFPWKLCLKQMKHGKRDGLMLLTKNAERSEYLDYTDVIMEDRDFIWYEPETFNAKFKQNFAWKTFEDLKPYIIGQSSGFNYGDEFTTAVKDLNLTVQFATKDVFNFKKLLLNRIDIFICNETSAKSIFNSEPRLKNKFKFAIKPFKIVQFHMAFSKKSSSRGYIPLINKTIAAMKQDGTIDKILGRTQ